MRVGTVVKILAAVVVAVVVGAVAVLMTIDVNQYKPQLEAQVEKATGRSFSIGGEMDLAIGFSPAIVLRNVTLSNADWGTRENMLSVDRAEAAVSLMPLFSGSVEVVRVELVSPEIVLETHADGRSNLDFTPQGAEQAAAEEPAAAEGGGSPLSIDVSLVRVTDGRLVMIQGEETTTLTLETLTAEAGGFGSDIALSAGGRYNDAPFTAEGTLGPISALMDNRPFPVDLALTAGEAEATVKGSIAEPAGPAGIELALTAAMDSLSTLSPFAGAELPGLGPLKLSGNLTGGAGTFTIADLALTLGKTDLSGTLGVATSGPRPKVTADLTSTLIDPDDFSAPGTEAQPEQPAQEAKGRVFSDTPLPLAGLRAVDADVKLALERVLVNGAMLTDGRVALTLTGGDLRVEPLTARLGGGDIDGSLRLDARRDTAALDSKLAISNLGMGALLSEMKLTDWLENGETNLTYALKSRGASPHQLMAGLNGEAALVVDKGVIKNLNADIAVMDLLSSLAPWTEEQNRTVMNCAVARLTIEQGVATVRQGLFDTQKMLMTADGTVDLGQETYDLTFRPNPKEKSLINIATPVDMTGPLTSPGFAPNTTAVVKGVAGAIASGALLGPVGLLVPLVSTGAADDNPCLEQTGADGGGQQEQAPQQQSDPAGQVKDAIKGLFGQ